MSALPSPHPAPPPVSTALPAPALHAALAGVWEGVGIGHRMGGRLRGRTDHGLRVLFVEKGPAGHPAERSGDDLPEAPAARLLRGSWPKPLEARVNGATSHVFGAIGCGVGGSSVFYAAALERPARHDLDDLPGVPHPAGGWVVGYDAFLPYFDQAARWLSLHGTPDPLSDAPPLPLHPPPPLGAGARSVMGRTAAAGECPHHIHLAIRQPDSCLKCFGTKCPRDCKMDGRSAGVRPALDSGRAALLTGCEVEAIEDDGRRVTGLRLRQGGREARLAARAYGLAAGALGSPRLLLATGGPDGTGAANSSGWVGRGLMFHLNEMFALWPRRGAGGGETGKTIALRDLYLHRGQRHGIVQSMGIEIGYGRIALFLRQVFDMSWLARFPRLRGLTRIPAAIAARLFGRASMFVGLMEDLPYPENRVLLNPDDPEVLTFEYRFHPELLRRRRAFRRAIRRAFRGHRRLLLGLTPALNLGHPSGTLRFGADPAHSVLNADCRSHDLDNLYVADASFMPSSLGVNPGLTIAANAIRVGGAMARALNPPPGDRDA